MAQRSEKPTRKKLEEARREGRVASSSDFTGATVVLAAGVTALLTFDVMGALFQGLMLDAISTAFAGDGELRSSQLTVGLAIGTRVAGPVLAVAFVTAVVVGTVQVGRIALTPRPLIPDGSRLSLSAGWRRLTSPDRIVDLTKNVLRLAAMVFVAAAVYASTIATIIGLPRVSVDTSSDVIRDVIVDQATFLLLTLVVFAIVDLAWQRHRFQRDLMMTRDEVRDERRQTEGDPQVRAEQKRRHRLLARDICDE